MGHSYYSDEIEGNNTQRLGYFDSQFEGLSKTLASGQGVTLSNFLSDVLDVNSFKNKLTEVFSVDGSLANYVDGMQEEDFESFFERPLIQKIVEANLGQQSELIDIEIISEPPIKVIQEDGKSKTFFKATMIDKKTGNKKRTIGYEDEFEIKGKKTKRLRDSKGRFVKKIS